MKILGNILWLLFGGLETALEYFVASIAMFITIIHYWHSVRTAVDQVRGVLPMALRLEGEGEGRTAWLSEYRDECDMVLCGRCMDMAHSYLLRGAALHHHLRHSLREAAFQNGTSCPHAVWEGDCVSSFALANARSM